MKQHSVLVLLTMLIAWNSAGCSEDGEAGMKTASEANHVYTNRLIDENSPYLLAHAHNPVDWYPWGEEALALAKKLDRPIFLSIGYAACHWCHVMERESFENEATAKLLNDNFVSIKVDREQRPDLDDIYMAFTSMMTGSGGWPMSVFLTPDLKPFYAGTYFPPDNAYGRPGFPQLLTELARAYRENKDDLLATSESIFSQVNARLEARPASEELALDLVQLGAERLMRGFDHRNGGFGAAPKFPRAMELMLFLRHFKRSGDSAYLGAAENSLTAMARGGIYDQIGGGFARYATDERWLVPHFEKMLYDNGLLVQAYAEAYQITGKEHYRQTVRETLDFILREMTDPSGGFYSALDADSEGEEGKFYTWSVNELKDVLKEDAAELIRFYNANVNGNFEGKNILHITDASEKLRMETGPKQFDERMADAKRVLLAERDKRVRPLTDDKILASWNGLALTALCKGYQITGEERYLRAAIRNAEFITEKMYKDRILTHSWRDGRQTTGQFLEDYGYYVTGLVELYQTDHSVGNERWLALASEMAKEAVARFQNDEGKLFLREEGLSDLIVRPSAETDGALPSPGSMLLAAMLKIGRLTGDSQMLGGTERGLKMLSGLMKQQPERMTSALMAMEYMLAPKIEVVLVGNGQERDDMLEAIFGRYLPNMLVAVGSGAESDLELFKGRMATDNEATAFVCMNSVCRLPVNNADSLAVQLDEL